MPNIADQLTHIVHAIVTVLRAFAAWNPPVARVLSLGHTTYLVPPIRRPDDNPHLPDIPADIRALLRDRATRALHRLLALFARWQAGTLPTPAYDFPRPKPEPRPKTDPRRSYTRLPRGRAWAGARLLELRQHAAQLSHLLSRPEIQPFLQACPQAGRLLRPLCHALGAALPPLLAPPSRAPLPRRQRPPKPRRPRLTDPDLNLPPEVIRAVRYSRKKVGPN